MFRLDRFLTLALFGPFISLAHNKGLRIPILMYHSISRDTEEGVHPYYRVVTTPEVFAQQMDYLAEQGYQVIGLEAAIKLLRRDNGVQQSMLEKPVVITFDDGFLDFYSDAFPILARHNFTATVFIPTGLIGEQRRTFNGKELLIWDEIRDLRKKGVVFGSHSMTHRQLQQVRRDEIEHELMHSKELLEGKLGERIECFSYPYAFPEGDREFVQYVRVMLLKCEYLYGVSTRIGTTSLSDSRLFMKRIPVNSCDDPLLFRAKLEGDYDWVHMLQYVYKLIKKRH